MSVNPKRALAEYCDCPYCQGCKIKREALPRPAKARKRPVAEPVPVPEQPEPEPVVEYQQYQDPIEEESISSPTVSSYSGAE